MVDQNSFLFIFLRFWKNKIVLIDECGVHARGIPPVRNVEPHTSGGLSNTPDSFGSSNGTVDFDFFLVQIHQTSSRKSRRVCNIGMHHILDYVFDLFEGTIKTKRS